MVHKCSAPGCNGNYYKKGPKVSIFKFPKDEDLRKKWLSALKMKKSFTITENTRVCEKHFSENDIMRTTSFFDKQTGRMLECRLERPRLKENSIPCILLNCPKYVSTKATPRENAEERPERLEQQQLQEVIIENLNSQQYFIEDKSFTNFHEFSDCIHRNVDYINGSRVWDIIKHDEEVLFLIIAKEPPIIQASVVVDSGCRARIFMNSIELQKLDTFSFPYHLKDVIELEAILTSIWNLHNGKKVDNDSSSEIQRQVEFIERRLEKLHKLVPEEQTKSVSFLLQQVKELEEKFVDIFHLLGTVVLAIGNYSFFSGVFRQ